MKHLHLDLISGISGDMFLGALIDLGVDFTQLKTALAQLNIGAYHLHAKPGKKAQITGTQFEVHLGDHHPSPAIPPTLTPGHAHLSPAHGHDDHHHHHDAAGGHTPAGGLTTSEPHTHYDRADHRHDHDHDRTFASIRQLIQQSPYSDWVKTKAIAVFQRIALAEGKIHGHPPEEVHFHEVGAVDSIIDIVGACLALEMLGQPRLTASAVTDGHGFVDCAHGRFPVPAPATLAILGQRGIPLSQCEEPHELVTPTGAALLAEFVESFGPLSNVTVDKIAYGLGHRNTQTRPNVLRIIASANDPAAAPGNRDWETDTITILETNLDDLNPELLGSFVDLALAQGALDVFYTAIQMKKNRPAVLLTVLCDPARADDFSELILRQTSAFGVRRTLAERRKLQRQFQTVQTSLGPVTVKTGLLNGEVLQAAPEFESCKQLAQQKGVPVKQVYELAARAFAGGAPDSTSKS